MWHASSGVADACHRAIEVICHRLWHQQARFLLEQRSRSLLRYDGR